MFVAKLKASGDFIALPDLRDSCNFYYQTHVMVNFRIIVKSTIKLTLSDVARLGNLASNVGFVFSRAGKYFRALL